MIAPRRNEIDAVIAVLESDEYESSADMAKALVKAVASELEKRDGFGVGIGLPGDDMVLPHGMFWSLLDAKRTVKEAQARGLRSFIAPLLGAANALTEEVEATHKRCICKHPQILHGSAIKPKAVTSIGCGVYLKDKTKCPCKGYEMEK